MEEICLNLSKLDETDYIKYNDKLNEVFQKVCYFLNYDLELNLFQMNIGLKDDEKTKLFEIIQKSYQVDVDYVTVNDEPATIKHILQKDKLWFCICGESNNPISSHKCAACGCFRKIESLRVNALLHATAHQHIGHLGHFHIAVGFQFDFRFFFVQFVSGL